MMDRLEEFFWCHRETWGRWHSSRGSPQEWGEGESALGDEKLPTKFHLRPSCTKTCCCSCCFRWRQEEEKMLLLTRGSPGKMHMWTTEIVGIGIGRVKCWRAEVQMGYSCCQMKFLLHSLIWSSDPRESPSPLPPQKPSSSAIDIRVGFSPIQFP